MDTNEDLIVFGTDKTKSTANPYLVRYVDDGSYWLHDLSIDNCVKREALDILAAGETTDLD